MRVLQLLLWLLNICMFSVILSIQIRIIGIGIGTYIHGIGNFSAYILPILIMVGKLKYSTIKAKTV